MDDVVRVESVVALVLLDVVVVFALELELEDDADVVVLVYAGKYVVEVDTACV